MQHKPACNAAEQTNAPDAADRTAESCCPLSMAMISFQATTVSNSKTGTVGAIQEAALPIRPDFVEFGTDVEVLQEPGTALPVNTVEPLQGEQERTGFYDSFRGTMQPWMPTIVAGWLVGTLCLSLRLGLSFVEARRLRRDGTEPLPKEFSKIGDEAAGLLGMRRSISVLKSSLVDVPSVVGFFEPVILLPSSALTGLPVHQLRTLLIHELAHIQRLDHFVNVFQTVIETLLFYHPAIWWISRVIREEREYCCDDMVLRVEESALPYAEALLSMEKLRSLPPQLALSSRGGQLLRRIKRLAISSSARQPSGGWMAASCVVTLTLLTILVLALPVSSSAAADADDDPVWGKPVDGLQMRAVPVAVEMDEDKVDMKAIKRDFNSTDELAFAIEMRNVGKTSI